MRTLSLVSILCLMTLHSLSGFTAPAPTAPPPNIPSPLSEAESVVELEFSQMERFRGFYATVIYGINNNLFISGSTNVHLNYVTTQSESLAITGDKLTFPSVTIVPPEGVWEAYNALILVIHTTPQFQWMNADNTFPLGGPQGNQHRFKAVYAISKKEYLKMLESQNHRAPITIAYPRR